jgi:hypothetical protein
MKVHHRSHRCLNYFKIYTMNYLQLLALDLMLCYLAWRERHLRQVHFVGAALRWPERKKYIVRLLNYRLYIWISVDTQ